MYNFRFASFLIMNESLHVDPARSMRIPVGYL